MPETPEIGLRFLKEKYELHMTPEVEQAVRRTEAKNHHKVSQRPEARIQNYLDRFKEIIERPDSEKRDHGVQAIKRALLPKFVTKFDEIPQSYWDLQDRIIRERGQEGDWDRFSPKQKQEARKIHVEGLLADQEASLEQWIDYLAGHESSYMPDYMKYWVFRSVTGLSEYDKEKHEFPNRSKGTVKTFPDVNQEALAYVIDAVVKKQKGQLIDFGQQVFELTPDQKQQFQTYLQQENFAKLYGWANEIIHPIPEHLLPVTDGQWKKYPQGSDHRVLNQSIQGRGTGWCTAGENTARAQLQAGDFHVFYSNDDYGRPTIPRIAIRMEDGKIAEVRGIAAKQNLDPYMGEVLAQKLEEFPDKDKYLKKDRDMKQLTEIDNKAKTGEALIKDELVFLYELDSKIEGFGQSEDPRIKELLEGRNLEEDMLTIFECSEEQIAHTGSEITENTRAYVGELTPGIFDILRKSNIEHLFTSFPEGKIRLEKLTIGGKTKTELLKELQREGLEVDGSAINIMTNIEFYTQSKAKEVELATLRVRDFGFSKPPTTEQLYDYAKSLGLELCPPEVGPRLRLQYKDKSLGSNYVHIAMEQIDHSLYGPNILTLSHSRLFSRHATSDTLWWGEDDAFVFCRS